MITYNPIISEVEGGRYSFILAVHFSASWNVHNVVEYCGEQIKTRWSFGLWFVPRGLDLYTS